MSEPQSKRLKPNDPIGNLLKTVKIDDTLFPSLYSKPISVTPNTSLSEAYKVLISAQILAIPVVDHDEKVVGVFSMMDVVNILIENIYENKILHSTPESNSTKTSEVWKMMHTKEKEKDKPVDEKIANLLSTKISDLKLHEATIIKEDTLLSEIVDIFLEKKVHRIVVVNKDGLFCNFVTISRAIELLSTILHAVPLANKTLESLKLQGIAIKEVAQVSKDDVAIKAFKTMSEKKVSAVVVVDHVGVAVGNISINDLKMLDFDLKYFDMLGATVGEYIEAINNPKALGANSKTPNKYKALRTFLSKMNRKIVTCSLEDTLLSVISTIKHYHIHRIFIEDENGHPIGVLSNIDLLKAIVDLKGLPTY